MNDSVIAPSSIDELKEVLASNPSVLPVGNRTKPPLSTCESTTLVSLQSFSGIIEYEPSEFTFTAQSGTRVSEIDAALAEKSQYLPFDPMLVDAGATIGGTVASGLSGPGRFRYGGIRDFLLGVRFLSGDGDVINAGGKVVKNAAGFDIPKFLVGSMGRFGAMTELTFKVFPAPIASQTLRVECESHEQAIERIAQAASSRWELNAIDYRPDPRQLYLRLGGPQRANELIADEIRSTWGQEVLDLNSPDDFWRSVRELSWPHSDHSLAVKVPTTPRQFLALADSLAVDDGTDLHWSVAGGVLWILLNDAERVAALDKRLQSLEMSGLVVRGSWSDPRIGTWNTTRMESSVKAAMDPPAKFPGY